MEIDSNVKKTGQLFSSLEMLSAESRPKLNMNSFLCNKYISYLLSGLSAMLYV